MWVGFGILTLDILKLTSLGVRNWEGKKSLEIQVKQQDKMMHFGEYDRGPRPWLT
jgi:hypothetical protein